MSETSESFIECSALAELPPDRCDCATCGPGVKVDEDCCCAHCGRDAIHIVGGLPEPMNTHAYLVALYAQATRAKALLTPDARLQLAAELLSPLPRGPSAELNLGTDDAALALIISLGGKKKTNPHVIGEPARAVWIDSASIDLGGVTVRAQGAARDMDVRP